MRDILICHHKGCRRGVYLELTPDPTRQRGQYTQLPSWWCYSGHAQNPEQLTYADEQEVDWSVPPIAASTHWSSHEALDLDFEAITTFCSHNSFDSDELDTSDWRMFEGEQEPHWACIEPQHVQEKLRTSWERHQESFDCYHVFIGNRAFFFWHAAQSESVPWTWSHFWQADDGEQRNGRIYIARAADGEMIGTMTSTRSGGMIASLATARSYLCQKEEAERIEIHVHTFDFSDEYQRKPLAVVTIDDISDIELASRTRRKSIS